MNKGGKRMNMETELEEEAGIPGNCQAGPERQKGKKHGAKQYSFFAQVFSGTWIIVLTVLKGLKVIALETQDIIYTGIAVAAIFSPVYFSIFLDKIRDIRLAK